MPLHWAHGCCGRNRCHPRGGVALSYSADGEVSTIFLSGRTDDDPSVLEGINIDTVIAEQGDYNEVVLRIGGGETMIALSGVNAGMIAEM